MKTILIAPSDLMGPFITPPENQGQMVEVSYASTETYILQKTVDRSRRTEKMMAYEWPEGAEYSPQNKSPELGPLVGLAHISAP